MATKRIVNKIKKVVVILVFLIIELPVISQNNNPKLIGYWHNWNTAQAPYIHLDEIDYRYNIVCVAFGMPANYDDMTIKFVPEVVSKTTFINKMRKLQDSGKVVLLSIGGATTLIDLFDSLRKEQFINSVTDLLIDYGFDGIDIDIEHGNSILITGGTISNPSNASQVFLIDAIKQIMKNYRNTFSKKMILTMAPETAFVQGGQSGFGSIWGGYLPIIHAFRDSIDILQVQLYNSGTMYGIDGKIYSQGTSDFIIAMTEAVVRGFNTNGGFFYGISENKVAISLPACTQAAGGGYVDSAKITAAVNYILGKGDKPGEYTLLSKYENLAGLMTWSINWDRVETCNGKYSFANTWQSLFNSRKLDLPEKVVLVYPSNWSKLQDSVISFKWKKSSPEVIKYEINILNNNNIIIKDTNITDTSFAFNNYNFSTQYFWKVRAYNQTGWSDWSDVWNFTTKDIEIKRPNKVTLFYPPDKYRLVSDTVQFSWEALDSNVTNYTFSLYNDGNLVLISTLPKDSRSFSFSFPEYDKVYQWQVVALNNGIAGEPSNIWTFYTRLQPPPPPPPSKVELHHPKIDSILYQDTVTFVWFKSHPVVDKYDVEADLNTGTLWKRENIIDTQVTARLLEPCENCKWRVRAHNFSGWGEWSDWWHFKIREKSIEKPIVVNLVSPLDSSIIYENMVKFVWNRGDDSIERYYLDILSNSEVVFQDSSIVDTSFVLKELTAGEYKWRVRGWNKSGYGDWSEYRKFFINLQSIPKYYEIIQHIYPNPTSNFLVLDFKDSIFYEKVELKIYNNLGECVLNEEILVDGTTHKIYTEQFPAGFYYLHLGYIIKKIMIIK